MDHLKTSSTSDTDIDKSDASLVGERLPRGPEAMSVDKGLRNCGYILEKDSKSHVFIHLKKYITMIKSMGSGLRLPGFNL